MPGNPKLIPLPLPPGVARLGTQYAVKGRWFDTHLVRWYQGVPQPVGGWVQLQGSAYVARGDDFPTAETISAVGGTTEATTANAPSFDDKYTLHYKTSVTLNDPGTATLTVALESFDGADWNTQQTKVYERTHTEDGTASFDHEDVTLVVPGQSSTEKFRLRAVSFVKPPKPVSDNFSASNSLTAVGQTTEATTASAPARDDIYQVHFSVVFTKVSGGGSSSTLQIAIETFDGVDWNLKVLSVFSRSTIGSQSHPHQIVTFTQVGQSSSEKVRLRIQTLSADATCTVHGFDGTGDPSDGVTYTVDADASFTLKGFNIATDLDPHAGVTYLTTGGGGNVVLTGICRGIFASERAVTRAAYLMAGTHTKIYHFEAGTLTDVTPVSGFTTGQIDTTYAAGTSRLHGTATEAVTWSLAEFVDANGTITPLACSTADGQIWQQTFPGGSPGAMTLITPTAGTVPTGVRFIFATPERFLVALGATSAIRQVAWCAQDDFTNWDFASDVPGTGAGANNLKGNGIPMCAVVGDGEHLILTDQELYAMRYIGGEGVYGFSQRGSNCGIISRRAFAAVNTGTIVWMGTKQFFTYDGYVRPIDCEVADYVFNDINIDQAAKVWAMSNTQFGEVWFFYPSREGATSEVDRYVVWNYQKNVWYVGKLRRLAGVDAGALQYPVLVDLSGTDSIVYEHERGDDRSGTDTPYMESGPVEIADGDQLLHATNLVPDEATLGDLDITIYSRLFPTGTETTHGPFSGVNPTPVRITARQVRLRLEENIERAWRAGTYRLEVVQDGRR